MFGAVESVDVVKLASIRGRSKSKATLKPALGRALPLGSRRTQRRLEKKHARAPRPNATKLRMKRADWAEGSLGRETKTW